MTTPLSPARAYRLAGGDRIDSVDPASVVSTWRDGDDSFWLDIDAGTPEVLDGWLAGVELPHIIDRTCREEGGIPRALPLPQAVLLRVPALEGPVGERSTYLTALCLPRLLVTFHDAAVPRLADLAEQLSSSAFAEKPTISGLVCLLGLQHSALALQMSRNLRLTIENLENAMDHDPDAVEIDTILDAKGVARVLETIADECGKVYGVIGHLSTEVLNLVELSTWFDLATGNFTQLNQAVGRHEKRLADLHLRYVLNVQEQSNSRLNFLTIVSAIFLPLTLIAGIYGMNFDDMPELHTPHAYPITLGLMAAIAAGMWLYFRKKGWFDQSGE